MKNVRYLSSFLVLLLLLVLTPSFKSKATGIDFNLGSDYVAGSTSIFAGGIAPASASGYLIYIVDANGNKISPDAKLVTTTSTNYFGTPSSTNYWSVTSRLGNYTCTDADYFGAEWGSPVTVSAGSGWTSNEPTIRAWMASKTLDPLGEKPNAFMLIKKYFSLGLADAWSSSGTQNLILEPVYRFRAWSKCRVSVTSNLYGIVDDFFTAYNAPYLVGTTKGLAKLVSSYLTYNKSVNDRTEVMTGSGTVIKYTNYAGFTDSPMSSGYAKGFCHAEKLTKSIGALSAGASGSGMVSYSSIQNSGYGILAITASDVGTPVAVVPPAPSGTYEGYINTLSVTGNNGSYSQNALLRGVLMCDTSAAGSEALALAQSLASGLSYTGSVPPIVYSGSGIELSVQSNSNIKTGLLQIDPSTFYGLTSVINTSSQADYQAFTNEIKNNIYSEINMLTRDGGTLKGSYNYDPSSYVASGVQGGAFKSSSTRVPVYCTLTQENSKTTGASPSWLLGGNYNVICNNFYQIYYNSASNDVASGRSLLESTDMYRALVDSTKLYEDAVKANGVLLAHWTAKMNDDRDSKSRIAGNADVAAWKITHPVPESVESPADLNLGVTDDGYDSALALYNAYLSNKEDWKTAKTAIYDAKYNSVYTAYNESLYTCSFTSPQEWKFDFYTCDPFYESQYVLTDKIPLNCGPSATAQKYFQRGYGASFVYSTNTSYSGDTSHLLTFLPFVSGATSNTIGGVSDVSRLVDAVHIMQADFIVPDMTTANGKN